MNELYDDTAENTQQLRNVDAHNFVSSPQPLPIRPRFSMSSDESASGHTRSPILARDHSTLQSFSRTIRTYVPSAIHIPVPLPAPSPPLLSTRPVSFASFSASKDASHPEHGPVSHGRSFNQPAGLTQALQHSPRSPRGMAYPGSEPTHAEPIQWARWDSINDKRLLILAYPSGFQLWDCTSLSSVTEVLNLNTSSAEWLGGGEIVHAALLPSPSSQVIRHFGDPYSQDRPLLGVIINLDNDKDSSTLFIYSLSRQGLIHQVQLDSQAISFEASPHFIVISLTNPATLQIYSPTTFKEIYTISSNSLVPLTHSRGTYSSLTSKLFTTGGNILTNIEQQQQQHVFLGPEEQPSSTPRPVFALSNRLLAYASPSPSNAQAHPRSPSRGSGGGPSSQASPSTSPFGALGTLNMHMHMTQADLGNAAIKVGGSFLSGMKTLGGMALTAAKNMASSAESTHNDYRHPSSSSSSSSHSQHRKYVSISAPSGAHNVNLNNLDSVSGRGRRYSLTSMTSQDSTGRSYSYSHSGSEQAHPSPVLPSNALVFSSEQGSYVTILDLMPLLSTTAAVPVVVAECMASRSQQVAGLEFSPDGCSLVVVPINGQVLQVWQVRPSPAVMRMAQVGVHHDGGDGAGSGETATKVGVGAGSEAMVRMYQLLRGRSQAVIDDVAWAQDGRWVAIGSQRPTVHVFAVNPYGGKPDLKSHTKGKVINVNELQPTSVEISPLVRLRASKPRSSDRNRTLAFTFIGSSESCLPSSLLPSSSAPLTGGGGGGELLSTSPHHRTRPTNYQDLLVFDACDGMLSLQRITTDVRAKDQSLSVAASVSALGATATSVSLPGLGGAGKLSSSPASSIAYSVSAASNASSKNTNPDLNVTHDLVGRESVVATWNLQRRQDWEEIRQPMVSSATKKIKKTESHYLAYAELSTFSRSPRILPRSIYLSHQFSFYTLGEDYHALIRRSQLDISGQKLSVRKNVEVSPFPSGGISSHDASESFIEGGGFTHPHHHLHHHHHHHHHHSRGFSGSFDEPLASALSGGLDYHPSIAPPVLPMYPNGAPGSRPQRMLRNSIPIRTIGDGMSEGLSLLRREINKVRSPRLLPRSDSGNNATSMTTSPGLVPLEFDEEDEDFLGAFDSGVGVDEGEREREEERRVEEVPVPVPILVPSPPSPGGHALIDEGDDVPGGGGWDSQDRQAVEDEERFHDLLIAPGLDFRDEAVMSSVQDEPLPVQEQHPAGSGSKKKKGKFKKR